MDFFTKIVRCFPLKGKCSILKNSRALSAIASGQNELMSFSHALENYYWGIEGHVPQRNKTEGMGIMISLIITREFGSTFGLK